MQKPKKYHNDDINGIKRDTKTMLESNPESFVILNLKY